MVVMARVPEQRHFDRLNEQQLLKLLQLDLCVQCIECVDCPDAALMYLTIVARNYATRKDTAAPQISPGRLRRGRESDTNGRRWAIWRRRIRAAAALSRVPRWSPAVGLRAVMCAA